MTESGDQNLSSRGQVLSKHFNVLFVCTGNSARSIMAEAILNFAGKPRFSAYSAGSHPSGFVRWEAIAQLQAAGVPTDGLCSKSLELFSQAEAPKFDFVFTVCDNAAKETCPFSQSLNTKEGKAADPIMAHWGVPDPAAVTGPPEAIGQAFREAHAILERRIRLFMSLPLASLDKVVLKKELDRIGEQ